MDLAGERKGKMQRERPNDLLEAQVRAARERGELEDLPGKGKPLALDDLDHLPADQRFDALLLRTCGEISAEVTLVREIRACRVELDSSESEPERARLRALMGEKVSELKRLLKNGG